MLNNVKVEAEHNELILENEYGDKVIIPANKRRWVQQKMKEGCNGCIDNLVSSLPTVEDYASDGALYPGGVEGFEGELNNENTTPTDPPINVYEKAPRKGARLIYDENDNIIGEETHRMGWGTMDDKFVVTPTLFQDDKGEWYEGDLREGVRRGESWTFDTQEEAEAFAAGSWKQYANDNAVNPITTLPEITVVPKENRYSEYRKQYIRENPFNINEWVQERFDNPTGRQKIQKINPQKFRQELRQAGIKRRNEEINKAVIERLYNENPQGEMSRGEWIDSFTEKEQQLLLTDPRFQTTLWQDLSQGLKAAAASTPGIAATQILESKDLSVKEKIQLLEQYTDNPVITNLLESFKMLSPLEVPAKAVQSVYKDDYSLGDALAGKKNNAGMIEDVATDPLNLVGAGIFSKLSKSNKIIDAVKAGSKLDELVDFSKFNNKDEFYRVIVGDEAFNDIVKTNQVRVKAPSDKLPNKEGTINLDRRGTTSYPSFSKGKPSLEYAKSNPNHYIITTTDNSIKPSTSGRHGKGTTMFPTDEKGKPLQNISADKVKIYKHIGEGKYQLVTTKTDDTVKTGMFGNLPKENKETSEELIDLYRIQEKNAKTFAQLAEEGKLHPLFNNPKTLARKAEEEKYFGQWFTKDKADLDWYAKDREFNDPEIIHLKVPKSQLEKYTNYDKSLSLASDREFVIPLDEQSLYRIKPPKNNKTSNKKQ
jgi:hypothetical protein